MLRLLSLVIAALVGIAGFFFYLRNDALVTVDYFLGAAEFRLPVLLLVLFALGVVVGWFGSLLRILAMRRRNAALQKRNDLATREIANLRSLPLRDVG